MKPFFDWYPDGKDTEELRYQAYKSRLAAESAIRIFPDLDCQGVMGDVGKIK